MLNCKFIGILLGICMLEGISSHADAASAAMLPQKSHAKAQMPAIEKDIESFFDKGIISDGAPAFGTNLYGLSKATDIFGSSARNVLQAHFENDFSYKNEHSTQLGLASLQYLSKNLYGTSALTNRHLSDGVQKVYYNLQSNGILYKFDRGSVGMSYDHYTGDIDMDGFTASGSYEFGSKTNLLFFSGKRPHNASGAVFNNISEHFYTLGLQQNINDRLTLGISYDISNLSDSNQYKNHSLEGEYKLNKTKAYADSLLFDYSHGSYAKFSAAYDSPHKTDYYDFGLRRDWTVPSQKRIWEYTAKLGTVRDNNEAFALFPSTGLKFIQNIAKNQQLTADISYDRYQKRDDAEMHGSRRENNYFFELDYSITW